MIIGFCVLVLLFFIAAFFVYKDKDKTKKFPILSIVFAACSAFFLFTVIVFSLIAIGFQGYTSETFTYELVSFDCSKALDNGDINEYSNIYVGTNDDDKAMFYYIVYKKENASKYSTDVINRKRDSVTIDTANANSNTLVETDYKLKNSFFGVWFWGYARTYTEYHFNITDSNTVVINNDFASLTD